MVTAHVLGGGIAGLTAAFALLDRGFEVVLVESHGWLGGRAFSPAVRSDEVEPPAPGAGVWRLDNGPHVMLGCYEHTIALCERLGTTDGFLRPSALVLDYRDARGRASRLQLTSRLPTPLAMGPAFLAHGGIPFGARLRAVAGLGAVLLGAPESWSFGDWLRRRLQTGAVADWVWLPMCRAIMNAEPDHVSARVFLRTLRRAFLGPAAAAAIWIPDRPWSELVGEPAVDRLGSHRGATLRLRARVTGLEFEGARVCAYTVGSGDGARRVEVFPGDLVVSAVPWAALAKLLDRPVPFDGIAGAPIVSAWLQLDPERVAVSGVEIPPLVALVGTEPYHFAFRRPGDPSWRFALLNGGGAGVEGLSVPELVEAARGQAAAAFPELADLLPGATVRITRENKATMVVRPGQEHTRPAPGLLDGTANLVVCGDWTATGLPSTLEGAAESAVRALDAVLGRR